MPFSSSPYVQFAKSVLLLSGSFYLLKNMLDDIQYVYIQRYMTTHGLKKHQFRQWTRPFVRMTMVYPQDDDDEEDKGVANSESKQQQ
jgi:hypothetical protein